MSTRKQRHAKATKHLTYSEQETIWMALGTWYDLLIFNQSDTPLTHDTDLSPARVLELMETLTPQMGHWLANEPTRWDELDDAKISELTERRERHNKAMANIRAELGA